MTETETIAETKGHADLAARITRQRRRIRNRLTGPTDRWPLIEDDVDELKAVDALLVSVEALVIALRTPSEGMVEAMRERVDLADWALKAAFTAAIDVLLTPKDPEQ